MEIDKLGKKKKNHEKEEQLSHTEIKLVVTKTDEAEKTQKKKLGRQSNTKTQEEKKSG